MKDLLEELNKELNWKEKLLCKIFKKKIIKICNIVRVTTINKMLS